MRFYWLVIATYQKLLKTVSIIDHDFYERKKQDSYFFKCPSVITDWTIEACCWVCGKDVAFVVRASSNQNN